MILPFATYSPPRPYVASDDYYAEFLANPTEVTYGDGYYHVIRNNPHHLVTMVVRDPAEFRQHSEVRS